MAHGAPSSRHSQGRRRRGGSRRRRVQAGDCGRISGDGGLVGILCGKPPWRQDTIWTTTLKGIFGAVVGGALYWGLGKILPGTHLAFTAKLGAPDRSLIDLPVLIGPLIGAVWGAFVELDDGGSSAGAKGKDPAPKR